MKSLLNWVKKNKLLNAAIEETVAVWDDLGDLNIPKNFEEITVREGIALAKAPGINNRLRDSMETMVEHDLLSADQVRGIETKLVEADDAYLRGTEAYVDMIKITRPEGPHFFVRKSEIRYIVESD